MMHSRNRLTYMLAYLRGVVIVHHTDCRAQQWRRLKGTLIRQATATISEYIQYTDCPTLRLYLVLFVVDSCKT